nr:hypothetical protein Iba_scaffold11197CG0020 [Ipomoea batatas]
MVARELCENKMAMFSLRSVLCVALGESGLGFSGGVRVCRRLGNLGRRGEQRAAAMADDERQSRREGAKQGSNGVVSSSDLV